MHNAHFESGPFFRTKNEATKQTNKDNVKVAKHLGIRGEPKVVVSLQFKTHNLFPATISFSTFVRWEKMK